MTSLNQALDRFGLCIVPIDALATSLAKIRGTRSSTRQQLTPTPIRVLADPEQPGRYEVVDGFKRLSAYREEGLREVVVLVEPAAEGIHVLQRGLVLLLHANVLTGTLSCADEARIVACLLDEHGLSPVAASRLLGKGKPWISKRSALASRLSSEMTRELDASRLHLSVAYAICALPRGDQVLLGRQIIAMSLPAAHALRLIEAYRVADTAVARQALLADPAGLFEQIARDSKGSDIICLTPTMRERVAAYRRLAVELRDLDHEPPLTTAPPNETRLLAAERERLEAQIAAHATAWRLRRAASITPTTFALRQS